MWPNNKKMLRNTEDISREEPIYTEPVWLKCQKNIPNEICKMSYRLFCPISCQKRISWIDEIVSLQWILMTFEHRPEMSSQEISCKPIQTILDTAFVFNRNDDIVTFSHKNASLIKKICNCKLPQIQAMFQTGAISTRKKQSLVSDFTTFTVKPSRNVT